MKKLIYLVLTIVLMACSKTTPLPEECNEPVKSFFKHNIEADYLTNEISSCCALYSIANCGGTVFIKKGSEVGPAEYYFEPDNISDAEVSGRLYHRGTQNETDPSYFIKRITFKKM